VADALELDEVLWIPAGDPPHKTGEEMTPVPVRLRMVRALTEVDDRFRVSEIEVRREGPSYTVDTLRALRESESRGARLYLIMGFDQYRAFEEWHRPDEIRELATLVVMDRRGEGIEDGSGAAREAEGYGGRRAGGASGEERVIGVPVRRIDISSTKVRAVADRGESIDDLVTPEVARIIEAEGLYRRGRD